MTDLKKLEDAIKTCGIPVCTISERTRIDRKSLYNKLKGKSEFKASEMDALASVIGLSDKEKIEIFLHDRVNIIHFYLCISSQV